MPSSAPAPRPLKTWRCLACGYIYDEAEGWPDDGIVAGTRWEDIRPAGAAPNAAHARKISRWSSSDFFFPNGFRSSDLAVVLAGQKE
jgi:rubredoxin